MKSIYKNLFMILVFTAAMMGCEKDEMKDVDPMVDGIINNVNEEIGEISTAGSSWGGTLLAFREQRIKVVGIKQFIEKDGYNKDDYALSDEDEATQNVVGSLDTIEFKMDSLWNEHIQDPFDNVDENSLGVQTFGSTQYAEADDMVSEAYEWLMADSAMEEEEWTTNDLGELQSSIEKLSDLSAMAEEDVQQFIDDVNTQYDRMQQQYADLESEVNTSPYFTKAQKELYATLEGDLDELGDMLEGDLSLDLKDEMDLVDRDLYSLVYFVENNYTSPAQKPKVYGEISSITELRWFSEEATVEDWNEDWVLTKNIDAAETHRWNPDAEEKGFQTIKPTVACNFDGQYHYISGLYMTKIGAAADGQRSGFFSDIREGSIRNLGLVNVEYVVAPDAGPGNQGGVLAGWLTNTEVSNCFVHGEAEALSQSGGFLGRPQGGVNISDCFGAVDMRSIGIDENTSSFIGLPVTDLTLENCYNIGESQHRAILGHGVSLSLTASGIYYNSESVGTTELDRGGNLYVEDSPTKLSDDGVTTDLPTDQWNDLGNFSEFSSDVWEIKTVPTIDPNPRPYLKGFDYEELEEFIVPGEM